MSFSVKFVRYMLSSGRTYSSVWHLVDKDGNYHNIVYSQDLNQTVIVARWITLRDFYQLTGNHLVSLHHYDPLPVQIILKMTFFISSSARFCDLQGWTHLHLEDVAKCRLVFNHWRKTLKIEAGWKHFCKTLSFTTDMEIVFEFIDSDVNCVLYWLCV
ncbi:hypothetical protein HKD37_18G051564 [Glycine soja]